MLIRLLAALLIVGSTACLSVADEPWKVVTYNIRYANPGDGLDVWPNRVDAVAKYIAENDVVGLQEVTLPQLVELRRRLDDFDSYGVGRDDGESGGEHAPIFYRRSRFEAVDQGTIWLSEEPGKVGSRGWDAALPRTCTWMILREISTNQKYWIANTHFDHRGSQARTESGKLIRRFALQRAGSLPVIVMGDFNCQSDADPYRALTDGSSTADPDDTGLRDARQASQTPAAGPTSTWNGFREVIADRIIDHIFVGRTIEVVAIEVGNPQTQAGRFASDHLPVRALVGLLPAGESGRAETVE